MLEEEGSLKAFSKSSRKFIGKSVKKQRPRLGDNFILRVRERTI
jgi:hypothetical protein